MSIKVYSISGAPSPWRVLLGLAFKDIDYELDSVSLAGNGLNSAEFLQLNRRATVPVVVKGEIVLRDSIAILAWLDREYPDKPLFGISSKEAARIWQIVTESAQYLRAANRELLSPIFFGDADRATPALRIALEQTRHELCLLETELGSKPFVAGIAVSAADAVAFPEIRLVQRAIESKPALMAALGLDDLAVSFPYLTSWMGRIEAHPGVDKSMPEHWSR